MNKAKIVTKNYREVLITLGKTFVVSTLVVAGATSQESQDQADTLRL